MYQEDLQRGGVDWVLERVDVQYHQECGEFNVSGVLLETAEDESGRDRDSLIILYKISIKC